MQSLIEQGWNAILESDIDSAERHFLSAVKEDANNADAWNGLGAVQFERGNLEESLSSYATALEKARASFGGEVPRSLVWIEEHKPVMRALHGIGRNLFRLERFAEAQKIFEDLLSRNPDDNQGVTFLLNDIKKKKSLWKK